MRAAAALLLALALAAAAQAAEPKMKVSPNWSGYVAKAPVAPSYGHPYFTRVAGTWTVPPAKCAKKDKGASSTAWVGLGGYDTKRTAEVGTDSNCSRAGKPAYFAWFELVPWPAYRALPTIKTKVSAGDTMTGVVEVVSPRLVRLKLINRTKGWTFDRRINFASQDTSTAEWIVSAPANCIKINCTQASLANFHRVTMRNISAVGRGSTGTLTTGKWDVTPIRLIPGRLLVPTLTMDRSDLTVIRHGRAVSPAGATPNKPSRDGSSFSVDWVKVANRGF